MHLLWIDDYSELSFLVLPNSTELMCSYSYGAKYEFPESQKACSEL
jgi:hypothetical protein